MDTRPQWLILALAVYCLVFVAQVRCSPAHATGAPAEPAVEGKDRAFTDLSTDVAPKVLRIPAKPEAWQKGPPCRRGEKALQGACYMRYTKEDMSPPCDPGIYEHDGQCWRAIAKAPREPSSVRE